MVWADGNLDSDLLFIGEGPGYHEDQQGVPFVGAAGQLLDKLLAEIGFDGIMTACVFAWEDKADQSGTFMRAEMQRYIDKHWNK